MNSRRESSSEGVSSQASGREDWKNLVDTPISEGDFQDEVDLKLAIASLNTGGEPLEIYTRMQVGSSGERNRALIEGRYADAGYPNDRYRAEMALIEEFGWWFNDDKDVVWTLMNWVCQFYPRTDTGERRKWFEEDDEWRESLFDNEWFGSRKTCDWSLFCSPYEERPEVAKTTKEFVLETLRDLEVATTAEIVEHSRVDRGERQVQRALTQLDEDDRIGWRREGNYTYYFRVGREPPDTVSPKE